MVRDAVRTKAFFDREISYVQGRILQKQSHIDAGAIPSPYGRVTASADVYAKVLEVIVMRYSRGDDLNDIRSEVTDLRSKCEQLRAMCDDLPPEEQGKRIQYERLSFDNYIDYLWWLSLAVCLNVGEAHLNRVLALIDNAGQDALLDRIALKLGDHHRSIGTELAFPRQYSLLFQALDAPGQEQSRLMKKFLDGWYEGNKNVAAWYDSHKEDDAGYVGYWCFEAALVVKLWGVDDSSFREHPHYPVDLVRYA